MRKHIPPNGKKGKSLTQKYLWEGTCDRSLEGKTDSMIEKHVFLNCCSLLFFGFLMVFLECSECKNVAKYFESLGKCSERSLFQNQAVTDG